MEETVKVNPLGSEKISKLIGKFAVPSIIAMVVGAMYNIVDQVFIGNIIGELGNAATNVAFPMTNLCLAFGLMFGHGGSAAFNLKMGAGEKEQAPYYFRNALTLMVIIGLVILAITEIFCVPILKLFGSPDSVLPYAETYLRITAIGFPFYIFSAGAGHLLRADGRPSLLMITNVTGTLLNIGLDALFMLGFGWGIAGAAWATIIGQFVAALIQFIALLKPKTVPMGLIHFIPRLKYFGRDAVLGLAIFATQISMMVVQIVLNNSLKYWGGLSLYGEEIPIATAGIIMKVTTIFSGIIVGLSQGNQPIWSFNYGAKQYRRVKEAYFRTLIIAFIISIINFIVFQCFPEFILRLFGDGSPEYFEFGCRYFRIFLFFCFLFFLQMLTANMFTAIGKPWKGMFLSLTRQILYFIPAVLILPRFFGIDGILYAQPLADFISISTAVGMAIYEMRKPEFRNEKGVWKEIFTGKKPDEITEK